MNTGNLELFEYTWGNFQYYFDDSGVIHVKTEDRCINYKDLINLYTMLLDLNYRVKPIIYLTTRERKTCVIYSDYLEDGTREYVEKIRDGLKVELIVVNYNGEVIAEI